MNKDLLGDKYGRFYELPQELAKRGHEISGLCLSYRAREEGHVAGLDIDNGLVDWYSVNLGSSIIPGLYAYMKKQYEICYQFNPDIIVACSDALQIINAYRLAKKNNIPCVADLYDNFEYYGLTRLPGILPFFKHSVKNVEGVMCVSGALKRYVVEQYRPKGKITVLTNGIPEECFYPMDKQLCRENLGLPLNAQLIGTAGALSFSRDIGVLFHAARDLIAEDSSIHLVMAGPLDSGTIIPEGANVHYLGKLDYEQVPMLFNALDVGIICNRDSSFGRYCFPQKAFEMLACGISVVAADVGTMAELFIEHSECLYAPGNKYDLSKAIRNQLVCPTLSRHRVETWAELAKDMESLLQEIVDE